MRIAAIGSLLGAALLSACGVVGDPSTSGACGAPGVGLSFAGQASLSSLGLAHGSSSDQQVGQFWVTAQAVPWPGSVPMGADVPPPARLACGEFGDGSGVFTTVPDDWTPPSTAAQDPDGDNGPLLVALAAVGLLVTGAVVAFRRR